MDCLFHTLTPTQNIQTDNQISPLFHGRLLPISAALSLLQALLLCHSLFHSCIAFLTDNEFSLCLDLQIFP